ncbi:MAG: glycosyltransferase family 4 protein [Desulfobacteraceae bacterium]|nr:glycosyltransferase family 4 protein [Desulfobacteraceae bacterium]
MSLKKLNILYISSKKKWGGVSSWMLRTAMRLEERGHCVWILAHPRGRFAADNLDYPHLVKRKLGMDYNPSTVAYLVYFIKKNRIDVVVTNIEKEVIAGGCAARICGIPNIRRVGREDDFNRKWKVKWRHRLLVDQCITPCDLIRDNAVKRAPWLDPHKFVTIHNGKNQCHFDASLILLQRRKWGVSENALVIGVTSQLSGAKQIDRLIRVFHRISVRFPDTFLVVTGEGKDGVSLIELAEKLNLTHRMVFAGYTTQPLLAAAAYDIAVSCSGFEGFPNTVVEYFAVGRPVVTTNAGGVSEMAEDGVNSSVVPVGDDDALHDALVRLIQSPADRHRLSQNAIATIEKGFSEDLMVSKLADALRTAIEMKHKRGGRD